MKNLFSIALTTAVLATTAIANDSTAVIESGGLRLVRDASVEILREDLFIAADRIEVNYIFRAANNLGTSTLVAFPLPEYDLAWLGEGVMGGQGETVQSRTNFQLWVNGQPHIAQIEIKALRNGIDVTSILADLGIAPESLDYELLRERLARLPSHTRNQLIQADLVDYFGDLEYAPKWTIKATYFWAQEFPAGQNITVRHVYHPFAGKFFLSDPELREFSPADFCMSSGEKNGVRNRIKESQYGAALGTELKYVLTTGANWRGPIREFNLTVDKGSADAMVSLCFGGLSKVSPTRFVTTRHNYVPKQELDILFVTVPN